MERKQLLGAVLDELQHQMELFKPERVAYLALAGVAALCLLSATIMLILQRSANAELAIGILGGAGLIAAAAGRTAAFFNNAFNLFDDLVKRYSKVTDADFESALDQLKKTAHVSFSLIVVGAIFVAGGVAFTFLRVRPLESEIGQKVLEVVKLEADGVIHRKNEQNARKAYEALKASVESSYGLHVMPNQRLVEVKGAAEALPHKKNEPAAYKFTVFLRGTADALGGLQQVRYDLRDARVSEQPLAAADAGNGFLATYSGGNCEPSVGVTVELKGGGKDALDFNLCKSLGWPEPVVAETRPSVDSPAPPTAAAK